MTQAQVDRTLMLNPQGIVVLPSLPGIGVVDTGSHRILLFDPYSILQQSASPQAKAIIGQANSCAAWPGQACRAPNNGNPSPSASTLSAPVAVALAGTDLLIADAGNNRVIGMPQQAGAYTSANRVLGQDRMDTFSINLIEGREFAFYSQFVTLNGSQNVQFSCADAGLAIDSTGDTPHLYVSDPCNNRVLGFKDARSVKPGSYADIVIGQPDMQRALCNYPSGNLNHPTQSSLCSPVGLAVDSGGNLYVADSGNGRVLRFPAPFAHQGSLPAADRVLGQTDFSSTNPGPSAFFMAQPYGLAFSGVNGLLVSDLQYNRVLYFPMANGDLTSPQGESAFKVFGQPDFVTVVKGTDYYSMSAPHHVSTDSYGFLYVADTGNNRVMIFGDPHDPGTPTGHALALQPVITPLSAPRGIYVSPLTGEIWVTDTGNLRSLRFPDFEHYFQTGGPNGGVVGYYGAPLALTEDQYGDLLVADLSNRVEFYYPGLTAVNGASFLATQPLSPGVLASIYPLGVTFGSATASAGDLPNPLPLPTLLADTQVLFNGQPAPLLYVSPGQINFLVPMSAPTSAPTGVDVQVVRQSTGQILADGLVAMNTVSPALFVSAASTSCSLAGGKCRQAAVINAVDGTPNSPGNPAAAGAYISIYATGQGFVQGAPPDGDIPRGGLVKTSALPHVWINACDVDDSSCTQEAGVENVQFSGLAPQFPGVWQINVRIPKNTGPGGQVPVLVRMNNYASQSASTGYQPTIAVKNQ